MIHNSNKTLLDLGKISYADFVWRRVGTYPYHELKEKPKPTDVWLAGVKFDPNNSVLFYVGKGASMELVSKTVAEWVAVGRLITDTWLPIFKCQLSNNHSLEFTGKKAFALYNLYLKRLKIKTKEKPSATPDVKPRHKPSLQLELL